MESLHWQVCLSCKELAAFAMPNDLVGVDDRGGPVESLTKGLADKSSWSRVVAALPYMDLFDELLPLLEGDAALQYAGGAAPVELAIYHGEGLDSSC